ncbi:MAG: hypothetical protein HYX34_08670 [Actinobacteria bacterium]|nr:hypothetical protein [Actinomycetota bacterium]
MALVVILAVLVVLVIGLAALSDHRDRSAGVDPDHRVRTLKSRRAQVRERRRQRIDRLVSGRRRSDEPPS